MMKPQITKLSQSGKRHLASNPLLQDIRGLIADARAFVAGRANATLTCLYWQVGKRISAEILGEQRAEYGRQILATLSQQLTAEFGEGYKYTNLTRMIKFAEQFPDEKIVATLGQQLGWSHFRMLIPLDDPLQRDFYAEMCRVERWSVRALRQKIDSMLFERTALSKKPEELIRHELQQLREKDRVSPDLVFRDPYFLGFLGLKDRYIEKDLEDAILREIEQFLLELGAGFAFIARQKRIQIGAEDYYIDLLFYHRRLNRLVAVDLKLGEFKAEYKGQMELYLRYLTQHDRQDNEEEPIGLILCSGKNDDLVELLELDTGGIRVAEYLTALPPRELLEQKLHCAVETARAKRENAEITQ